MVVMLKANISWKIETSSYPVPYFSGHFFSRSIRKYSRSRWYMLPNNGNRRRRKTASSYLYFKTVTIQVPITTIAWQTKPKSLYCIILGQLYIFHYSLHYTVYTRLVVLNTLEARIFPTYLVCVLGCISVTKHLRGNIWLHAFGQHLVRTSENTIEK